MADLTEESIFHDGIYQIEKSDPVEGGAPEFDGEGVPTAGWDNAPNKQLADRTVWLKAAIDALGSVQKVAPAAYDEDMNDLTAAGWYEIASTATNKPATGKFICLVMAGAAATDGAQYAFRLSDNTAHYRSLNAGDWGSWRRLVTEDELGTAAAANTGTGASQVPRNSDLGSAAFVDVSALGAPAGQIAAFGMEEPPDGWLRCDGGTISRSTYSRLFDAIGVTWGAGDGSTTFHLPRSQNEFLRGEGGGSGLVGSSESDQIRYHKHVVPWGEDNVDGSVGPFGRTTTAGKLGSKGYDYDNHWFYTNDGSEFETPRLNSEGVMGNETRPRSIRVLFCIKY